MRKVTINTIIFSLPIFALLFLFILYLNKTSPQSKKIDETNIESNIGLKDEQKENQIDNQNDLDGKEAQDFEELMIEDIFEGTGEEAKFGDTVKVHYIGTLIDGSKFDSSYDKGEPFVFKIGAGNVIEGWEQGIPGMKVGGKRKIKIPSNMGYGENGSPPSIPGKAGLVFEVELLEVVNN